MCVCVCVCVCVCIIDIKAPREVQNSRALAIKEIFYTK